MVDQKLIDYVNSAIKSGKSIQVIRTELLNEGWPENDVNEAIRTAGAAEKPREKPAEKKEEAKTKASLEKGHRNAIIIGLVVIIVIFAVVIYYVTTMAVFNLAPLTSFTENCGNEVCDPGENYYNCPADCPQAQAGTGGQKVRVSPAEQSVNVGDTVVVEIRVSNANDLYAYQYNVEYDPDVLQYVQTERGDFLGTEDKTLPVDLKISSGFIANIAKTRLGSIGGVNGEGLLERITFTAVGAGNSEVKISNIKFLNSRPEQIETTGENGQVTVS